MHASRGLDGSKTISPETVSFDPHLRVWRASPVVVDKTLISELSEEATATRVPIGLTPMALSLESKGLKTNSSTRIFP